MMQRTGYGSLTTTEPAMQIEITNKRNEHGVKYSADQYRTINGEHYICWMFYVDAEIVEAYRAAGLKCRAIKGELYLRNSDIDAAVAIDKSKAA
jgi:hypothetical protein